MAFIYLLYFFLLLTQITSSDSEETNSTVDFIAVPGKPGVINIQNITDTSAHVVWTEPTSKINITQYELEAKIIHTFSKEILYTQKWTFSNNIFRSEIADLHPGTKYNVSIRALSKNGPGVENYAIFETQIAEPDQTPEELEIIAREGPKMVVRITPVDNNNGPLSFYRIVVMNLNQMQVFQSEFLKPYDRAIADGLSFYIAADIKPEDIRQDFVIGDRRTYNGFYNAPLDPDSKYIAFIGIVSNYNGLTKVRYPEISARRTAFKNASSNSEGAGLVTGLAVAVGIASVLLIIGVIVLVLVRRRFHRNRRQRLSDNQELCVQGPMIQVANNGYIPDEDLERVNHYDALKKTVWSIPRDNLNVDASADGEAFLGFGSFGHVVRGSIKKLNEKTAVTCACYVVTDGDLTQLKKRIMLRQLDVLIRTGTHEHVAGLIGTYESPENVYVVLEYSPNVFKEVLLNDRYSTNSNGKFTTISEYEMLDILIGISNGMNHLSQKNLVHERLCARNIFMFNGNIPKITGHGLSHYNRSNAVLDFSRWTAQEVLNGKQFSVKSDIWSYGVLMWEICCIGGTPYNRLDNKMFVHQVCRGVRLPKFPWISEEFYQLMISCWQTDPGERPSFHEIAEQLQYFKDTLSIYNHLNFEMTPGFVHEVCDPNFEYASEDICQRNIVSS